MKDHKNIAHSINAMSSDINSEVILADLLERGLDFNKIIIEYKGLFKRNYSKDILDVYIDGIKDILVFVLSRDSMYDILPEGVFHSVFGNLSSDNYKKEIEKQKKEEANARKFFRPFDNEFYYQKLKLETELIKFYRNPDYFFQELYFSNVPIPERFIKKLTSYILFADNIIGNIELTAQCLSDIIGEKVEHSKYFRSGNKVGNDIDEGHKIKEPSLGVNLICGGFISEERDIWEFSVILGENPSIAKFIDKENGYIFKVIEIFYEYFIPYEIEVNTKVICDKSEPFVLSETNGSTPELVESANYLGYNSIL